MKLHIDLILAAVVAIAIVFSLSMTAILYFEGKLGTGKPLLQPKDVTFITLSCFWCMISVVIWAVARGTDYVGHIKFRNDKEQVAFAIMVFAGLIVIMIFTLGMN